MGTHISQAQLDDIKHLRDSHASPKQIWERFGQYGDSYGKGAVEVFRPDSHGWYVVRSIWNETGADISKFDAVARKHIDQYIDLVQTSRDSQGLRLPNSAQIEDSYVRALESQGLTAKTAIDVVVSKMIDEQPIKNKWIPEWYDTPAIMTLEESRQAPSFPHVMNKVSYQEANHIYKEVGLSVVQQEAQEAYLRTDRKMPHALKDGSWGITPIEGVRFYRNSSTENWAIYDKNGEGILYLDGHKENVDKSNFRLRPDAQHEFFKNGHWQIVELDKSINLNDKINPNLNQNGITYAENLVAQNDKPAEPAKAITKDSSIDDMFDALWAATVNKDDAAARAVGKAYGESADGQAWLAMGRELNQQDKLQEQQAALDAQKLMEQQAALGATVRSGPVMRMG